MVKDLTKRVSAVTIVFTEAWLDALILLPLALWQTVGAGYQLTTRDLVAGLILGVVCTALAYLMWTYGMGMIKVQHSSILGYLEPVSAPIYALLLLGQGISRLDGGRRRPHRGRRPARRAARRARRGGRDVAGAGAVSGGSHRLRGYAMVGGSAVMFGATGVWVGMTDLPASTVLCMRMALAAVLVALLGGAARWVRQSRRPGVWRRLLALGLLDALQLYTFMLALRHLDVALAVFLSYMSPIYIALVAPRLLRQRTEPVVIAALVLAVSGIVVMLAPGLMDPALRVSALGVAVGLVSGLLLAVFFLVAKTLSATSTAAPCSSRTA